MHPDTRSFDSQKNIITNETNKVSTRDSRVTSRRMQPEWGGTCGKQSLRLLELDALSKMSTPSNETIHRKRPPEAQGRVFRFSSSAIPKHPLSPEQQRLDIYRCENKKGSGMILWRDRALWHLDQTGVSLFLTLRRWGQQLWFPLVNKRRAAQKDTDEHRE